MVRALSSGGIWYAPNEKDALEARFGKPSGGKQIPEIRVLSGKYKQDFPNTRTCRRKDIAVFSGKYGDDYLNRSHEFLESPSFKGEPMCG